MHHWDLLVNMLSQMYAAFPSRGNCIFSYFPPVDVCLLLILKSERTPLNLVECEFILLIYVQSFTIFLLGVSLCCCLWCRLSWPLFYFRLWKNFLGHLYHFFFTSVQSPWPFNWLFSYIKHYAPLSALITWTWLSNSLANYDQYLF